MLAAIHHAQLAEHGGLAGVRAEGAIASALARPQQRLAYDEDADLAALAAAYGFGLARSHGSVDGNKRVAFMAMYVFPAGTDGEAAGGDASTWRLKMQVRTFDWFTLTSAYQVSIPMLCIPAAGNVPAARPDQLVPPCR